MSQEELFEDSPHQSPIPGPSDGEVEAIRLMLNALMAADRRFGGRRIRRQAYSYLTDVIEPILRGYAPEALPSPGGAHLRPRHPVLPPPRGPSKPHPGSKRQ
ncbi:hypothetical protein E1287_06275 [Actinomadura sp. KC06]|uniref:hypothetical protein n=1 Tax=Actinomadura sp. KC06 TaxID=2530369 RepID=UPI00104CD769|nr:hypothetical protein [Actinomadura sp. KC06]TDD38152.1 hypothetical protein E1287_06275 [Actinomadura sp. KC06]